MDFYDAAATFLNETTTTFCCSAKLRFVLLALEVVAHIKPFFPSLLSITCGRGVSCAGQCSAIGDQFCPTGAGTRGTRKDVNYHQVYAVDSLVTAGTTGRTRTRKRMRTLRKSGQEGSLHQPLYLPG